MEDSIYGPKFKELRKEQNITQQQAAQNVTSKSALSRWENGSDNLSFSQVLKLLNKIHIQPIEFINYLISPEFTQIADNINEAYVKNNIRHLHRYALKFLSLSRSNLSSKKLFLEACMTCNFYRDLSSNNLLTHNEIERLNNILKNISEWNYENIFYFCNTVGLLSSNHVYRLTNSLINYSNNEKLYLKKWYHDVLNAVLNAVAFLMRTNYKMSESLLKKFFTMKISDRFCYEKLHAQIFEAFLVYIKTKNDQRVKQIIDSTRILGLDELNDGFITGFKQIKKIYG